MSAAFKTPTREQINLLMSLPQVLKTDDGRILSVRVWAPRSRAGKLVTVKIKALVLPADPRAEA